MAKLLSKKTTLKKYFDPPKTNQIHFREPPDSQFGITQKRIISGIPVYLPVNPYPAQIQLIFKIIEGLKSEKNCLLESPTGTGKSLALLCSTLAWQSKLVESEIKKISQKAAQNKSKSIPVSPDLTKVNYDSLENVKSSNSLNSRIDTDDDAFEDSTQAKRRKISDNAQNFREGKDVSNKLRKLNQFMFLGGADNDDSNYLPQGMKCDADEFVEDSKYFCQLKKLKKKCQKIDDNFYDDSNLILKASEGGISLKSFSSPDHSYPIDETMSSVTSSILLTPASVTTIDDIKTNSQDSLVFLEQMDSSGKFSNVGTCRDISNANNPLDPETLLDIPIDPNIWSNANVMKKVSNSIPKIFYATRTHAQIKQVVKEFSRTHYRHTPMVILASRGHLCINHVVNSMPDKNENCKELVKQRGCSYHTGSSTLGRQEYIKSKGLDTAWDIEDIIRVGKKEVACPYYASRSLKDDALIVFCPYNYLIDPIIRKEMNISLKGQIVILDESHNIEGSCREAASTSFSSTELNTAQQELAGIIFRLDKNDEIVAKYELLNQLLRGVANWVCSKDSMLQNTGYEIYSLTVTGEAILPEFATFGFTPDTLPIYWESFGAVCGYSFSPTMSINDEKKEVISSAALILLEYLLEIMTLVYRKDKNYIHDYVVTISKKPFTTNQKQYFRYKAKSSNWEYTLNIWCLNPAVIFDTLSSTAHSIILTSGTLSPMVSFESELSCQFEYQLQANHVISPSQAWIGVVKSGPSGIRIEASYKGLEQLSVQDEIGRVIIEVCAAVSDGILCFLPSYSVMDKLKSRWEVTGALKQILLIKLVVWEPRGSDKTKFTEELKSYFEAVSTGQGALLVGVYRGKASEGMDFADSQARAVLCVGIPYPNFKDEQVIKKREFNEKRKTLLGPPYISGKEWYEIEAFRALNQALGRCIRHKNDWGSIVLVDARYCIESYRQSLSKWAREKICVYTEFGKAISSLKQFSTSQNQIMQVNACIDDANM